MALLVTVDIVTVYHNARNYEQAGNLLMQLREYETDFTFTAIDNRGDNNIGFGPACNLGAARGTAEVIGLLNPDLEVKGAFLKKIESLYADPILVICGETFGKDPSHMKIWGCATWVCGAAFFVRRTWWEKVGGFDPAYLWGWEETDLCRLAQQQNKHVRALDLPLVHESPSEDSEWDQVYKNHWFTAGSEHFQEKWGRFAVSKKQQPQFVSEHPQKDSPLPSYIMGGAGVGITAR
jgi:GT2 family glycosyltransferase